MRRIETNIPKLYLIRILRWFMLIIPVIVLFYQDNGLSMKEVLFLQSFFSVIIVLLEVPSGYLADRIGRRQSIIIGSIMGTAGFATYCFSYAFWGFILAELFLGIAASLVSGADSALLYDSLLQAGKSDDYSKIEGRYQSMGNFSEGIAAIVGGLLATISLRLPLYFETALMAVSIPFAFSLIEPQRKMIAPEKKELALLIQITKESLLRNKKLKWLILFSGLIGASTLTSVWFIQPYLKTVGLPLALFGLVWAILQFSVGGFSWIAHRIEKKIGPRWGALQLIILTAIAYVLLGFFQSLWMIPVLLLFYYVRGFSYPVFKDYINRITASERRATVLSIKNLVSRLLFAISGPFIGWINDLFSLRTALLTAGGLFFISGIIFYLMLNKHRFHVNNSK